MEPFLPLRGDNDSDPVFEGYSVPDGIVSGDPHERIFYHVEDKDLKVNAGYWTGEPGQISFDGFPWNEFCVVLEGELEVREIGKAPILLAAGDSFFIRKSFKGEWVIKSPLKKYFIECTALDG